MWYSGKAHAHGGNIQAVIAPDGFPLWVSEAEPDSVHDITAARLHALPGLYRAAATGLPTLADPGYDGAGIGIHIPVKQPADGRDLGIGARTRNAMLRSLRCLGERGFALITQRWRTLQRITASPSKAGDIARAALTLTHSEHGYSDLKPLRSPHYIPSATAASVTYRLYNLRVVCLHDDQRVNDARPDSGRSDRTPRPLSCAVRRRH